MTQTNLSRRELLKFSGATVGASTLAGLAGCVGEVPLGGTRGNSGGNSQYVNWLYEPGEVANINHYSFARSNLEKVRNNEDVIDESLYDSFEQMESVLSGTGVDFDEMRTHLSYQSTSVATGSYSTDDVTSELEDNNFDDDTEHENYAIFLSADEVRAIGVNDQSLIACAPSSGDATDAVETIIDTNIGNADRYAEENSDLQTLSNSLGTGAYIFGRTYKEQQETNVSTGVFKHSVAGGFRWRINGETSNIKRVIVFEEQDDVDTDDVNEWINENQGSNQKFDDVDDTTVEQKGRRAVITATIDTDDVSTNEF